MLHQQVMDAIARAQSSKEPAIALLKRAETTGHRVGVFASSFNPITTAHTELMDLARSANGLDEILALAGVANADKSLYECSLEDRLEMVALASKEISYLSVGVSSHPYFADLVEALQDLYSARSRFFFILGFDTFERVIDREEQYWPRYHRSFAGRSEALQFLLERAGLIVARRGKATSEDIDALLKEESIGMRDCILYLETPAELAERSASEVRRRARKGQSIAGLVPAAVETYIAERKIYKD